MDPSSEHGLHHPSNNPAINFNKEKKKKKKLATQKQRTLNFTNTGRATAGQPRLKERERAPPHPLTSPPPKRSLQPARAHFYSSVKMTLFQLR